MDQENNTVTLYALQADPVIEELQAKGVCFSKREYVKKKYQESAPIFLAAYDFYVSEAVKYVPKPEGAEYPYWAFQDIYSLDTSGGGNILKLEVPRDQVVFFDMYEFKQILCLKYMGKQEEERKFQEYIRNCGIRREVDIFLTPFYPNIKREITESWKQLFRHHNEISSGELHGVVSVQAGLWQIKKEWIITELSSCSN